MVALFAICTQCDFSGVEQAEVAIFLIVPLIQKTALSPGIQVMHPEKYK